jgi:hypothetical protein
MKMNARTLVGTITGVSCAVLELGVILGAIPIMWGEWEFDLILVIIICLFLITSWAAAGAIYDLGNKGRQARYRELFIGMWDEIPLSPKERSELVNVASKMDPNQWKWDKAKALHHDMEEIDAAFAEYEREHPGFQNGQQRTDGFWNEIETLYVDASRFWQAIESPTLLWRHEYRFAEHDPVLESKTWSNLPKKTNQDDQK